MSKADAGRLIHIAKRRERAKEAIEQRRKKIEEETNSLKSDISTKFTANYDAVEETLKSNTVGLVTLDEMREKQKDVVEMREAHLALDNATASKSSVNKEEGTRTDQVIRIHLCTITFVILKLVYRDPAYLSQFLCITGQKIAGINK
ncbi:hypothetical protein AB6A40_007013 [Gnathostoma spinigerum]|uniref:Protein FAM50 homolog n=1 Tax=Gnathostoma spinigerum TaxID=75299 RepID=A0ABD6EQ59_9BILA